MGGVNLALSVMAVIIPIYGLYWALKDGARRQNAHPVTRGMIPPIRRWKPSHFQLAIGHLEKYADAIRSDLIPLRKGSPEETDADDLKRWFLQLLLTAASIIIPNSQGKANLFYVSQIERGSEGHARRIHLASYEFVGVFPLAQLTEEAGKYLRAFWIALPEQTLDAPVAATCARANAIQLVKVDRRTLNEDEIHLGTTHILGIPIVTSVNRPVENALISLTIDLKFRGFKYAYYSYFPDRFTRTTLYARACTLQDLARRLVQELDRKVQAHGSRSQL